MADELLHSEGPAHIERASQDNDYPPRDPRWSIGIAVVAVVASLISIFVLGAHFSNPETYRSIVEALDAKRDTVMNLIGASTGSSAAVSLLPGDAGTPIAEKLVDLSSDFLVVIAAIYLEKYLLTILGAVAFKWLIPIGLLLFAGANLADGRVRGSEAIGRLGMKLVLFGLVSCAIVPVSVRVSGMIEETYEASITQTIQTAEQTTSAIEESASEGESDDASNPLSFLLNVPEELSKLTDSARNSLNNFIEALAVMIVTSCIIPLLVLVFFVWLAKLILGIDIDLPAIRHRRRLR